MEKAIQRLQSLGICVCDILIPRPSVDLKKWAVVACDQFTSEPEYWNSVAEYVKDAPSTLHCIYPEVYLGEPNPQQRIDKINATMHRYLDQDLFTTYEQSMFLVHRETMSNRSRWGLMVALDLEKYEYGPESRTLIRATEGTIMSRIPPRKLIRKDAPLEFPHILVLINDAKRSIIEPLVLFAKTQEKIYETDLMKDGGHLSAYRIVQEALLDQIATACTKLYEKLDPNNPLLFAVGDGNHSLATAKSCWEDIKQTLCEEAWDSHPARYAMVELENIYDEGLVFEPIHRMLFSADSKRFFRKLEEYCASYQVDTVSDLARMAAIINRTDSVQRFGYVDNQTMQVVTLTKPSSTIAAGTLQSVIDSLLAEDDSLRVDYIHSTDVTYELALKKGNIGLFLPAINKSTLFDTIVRDGTLPRKTFSMGHANEKRYYMEGRKIR